MGCRGRNGQTGDTHAGGVGWERYHERVLEIGVHEAWEKSTGERFDRGGAYRFRDVDWGKRRKQTLVKGLVPNALSRL